MRRRELLGAGLAGAAAAVTGMPAVAQNFPSKPVRWIVPFAPAGNYDVTSRIVAEAMSRRLGQTVVVDNRPGAGGVVGLDAAAAAPADGYTVVMASFSVLGIAPYMAGKASMVPLFAPISLLTTVPTLIVTRTDSRFADMKAVLAEAKAKPGTVSIGHSGNGTINHVADLQLQASENVKFNIIPYRGSGPGLADLMAGQIDLYTDQLTTSLPLIRTGKIRPLLILGPDRISQLPDVPGLKDIGIKPFDGSTTAGVLARAETPPAALDVLNAAVVAALNDDEVKRKLVDLGAEVRPTTRADFAAHLKEMEAVVAELVKSGLLKPE
ncbi:MAG: tripartite tricarboxylate transporter substrate binding protein [Reyranella sp.]|nr:tripartite tricarboxylate transporter substrate binding protein [Reyranella sp.]